MDFVFRYQNLKKSLQPLGPIFLAAVFFVASSNARLEAKKLPAPTETPNRAELPIPIPAVAQPPISAPPPSIEFLDL